MHLRSPQGEQLVHFHLNTERLKERLHAAQPQELEVILHRTKGSAAST